MPIQNSQPIITFTFRKLFIGDVGLWHADAHTILIYILSLSMYAMYIKYILFHNILHKHQAQ